MAFELVLEKWVEFRQVEMVNKQNVKIGGKVVIYHVSVKYHTLYLPQYKPSSLTIVESHIKQTGNKTGKINSLNILDLGCDREWLNLNFIL